MAEEDFDIDFYGDEGDASNDQQQGQPRDDTHDDGRDYADDGHGHEADNHMEEKYDQDHPDTHDDHHEHDHEHEHDANEPTSQQGTKRKSPDDDRPIDAGATAAVMISELNWWTTDDDIRGWLRQADSEDEVKELTFSEHKVNGKSKGQAYVEFHTPQAATAAKHYIDQLSADGGQLGQKKISTQYWNPGVNPFRTLPKDAPARVKEQPRAAPSGPYNDRGSYGGGYRGRGGYRGGGMNQNYNRNFNNNNNSGGGMGYNNNNNNHMGGGYNNQMGGGGNFGGFNNRGGMMGGGMRGGPGGMRGGRGGNMMGMNPMGNMPMGMPGNMGMGMMPGGMPGFQGMPQNFNGGFGFGQQQGGGNSGDWGGNPHGAKRPRPE